MSSSISLNAALSEWRLWNLGVDSKPTVSQKLTNGLTNESYLIETAKSKYKLRLNARHSYALGINRESEEHILNCLTGLNIAPALIYSDAYYRYSVFEYIDGESWTESTFKQHERTQQLDNIIQRYQALNINIKKRNYLHYLQNYTSQLDAFPLDKKEKMRFEFFCDKLHSVNGVWPNSKLCHHDLVAENIIENESGIYIIDWEYAALGCAELDRIALTSGISLIDPLAKELAYWLDALWRKVKQSKQLV